MNDHIGPVGRAVASNIRRGREAQRLTYVAVEKALAEAGRPIPALGLRRIERGERRVDVDDLLALARVLGVMPTDLLVPDQSWVQRMELRQISRSAEYP